MSCMVAVWCGVVACGVVWCVACRVWCDVVVCVVWCMFLFLFSSRRRGPIQNEDPISRSIGNKLKDGTVDLDCSPSSTIKLLLRNNRIQQQQQSLREAVDRLSLCMGTLISEGFFPY